MFNLSLPRRADYQVVPFEERHTQSMHELAREQQKALLSLPLGATEQELNQLVQTYVLDHLKPGDGRHVLEVDGKPKGFVVTVITDGWRKNKVGHLGLLAVDPSEQGRGGGQLLVKTALTSLKQQGVVRAHVQVTDPKLGGFYQKCGFHYTTARTKCFAEKVCLLQDMPRHRRVFCLAEAYGKTWKPVAKVTAYIYTPPLVAYLAWQTYQNYAFSGQVAKL